eukprot:GHVN01032171.1.p1 GENE.GHVN01032171.1~~GHVN01032171.1.p1  ORF type:complete len:133 (-),score=17.32 GHVN01032171.1:44-442(-)
MGQNEAAGITVLDLENDFVQWPSEFYAVFVSNIPEDATKEEIFALISAAGGIADMTLTVLKNATKKQMAVWAVADVSFFPHSGHLQCLLLSQLHPARLQPQLFFFQSTSAPQQLRAKGSSSPFLKSEHFLSQ